MVQVKGMQAAVSLMHGGFNGPNQAAEEALDLAPDFLAADAGSTDAGPAFLGGERGMTHRGGIKASLEYILPQAVRRGIPFIIGSAGLGGNRTTVGHFREIIEEVAREKGLNFRLAVINSEQDKDYLRRRLRAGKIKPLAPSEPLTEDVIDRATHVVGMMGTEPVEEAIRRGADVVLCGRISDSAMFAAVPIMRGVPPEQAWHMAKVIDHSGTNIEPTRGVSTHVIGVASDDHFLIKATDPHGRVSAHRAAHATTYENNSPNYLLEPPGMLDISDSQYEQLDDRTIKVTGSRFVERPYTIKLEGAERIGYRSITLGGTRDPVLISVLDEFLDICKRRTIDHAAAQGIGEDDFKLLFRVYGRNEVMRGWDPDQDFVPKEVGIVADCVAETQETANAIMNMCHAQLLHYNYPGRIHTTGNFAFPYSPSDIECGPVYRFSVWHLLEPDDPMECCDIEIVDL